jgi:hypothetical protein
VIRKLITALAATPAHVPLLFAPASFVIVVVLIVVTALAVITIAAIQIIIIIQFNSILIYVCANSTAQGPITKLARVNESK